jgi:hypothetical protein
VSEINHHNVNIFPFTRFFLTSVSFFARQRSDCSETKLWEILNHVVVRGPLILSEKCLYSTFLPVFTLFSRGYLSNLVLALQRWNSLSLLSCLIKRGVKSQSRWALLFKVSETYHYAIEFLQAVCSRWWSDGIRYRISNFKAIKSYYLSHEQPTSIVEGNAGCKMSRSCLQAS